jgi:hypothetical protein
MKDRLGSFSCQHHSDLNLITYRKASARPSSPGAAKRSNPKCTRAAVAAVAERRAARRDALIRNPKIDRFENSMASPRLIPKKS